MTILDHLVEVVECWPTTAEEMEQCSGGMFYFERQPDGRIVALTLYPLKPEIVTYDQWEEENMRLIAPMVAMRLTRIFVIIGGGV